MVKRWGGEARKRKKERNKRVEDNLWKTNKREGSTRSFSALV